MTSSVLTSDPAANNKAAPPNKNDAGLMSDAKAEVSSDGDHDGSTRVDLRVHKREECRNLGKKAKETLRI